MNYFDFVRPATKALWTFDNEDCLDSSPNGNDLTLGTPTYDIGRFGQAVYFSGAKFKRASTSYPSLALTTFSILCWIKTANNAYQTIFSFEDAYNWDLTGYCIGTWDGNAFLSTSEGTWGDPQFIGNSTVDDGAWHWLAITRGSTYSRIYVDGKLDLQSSNLGLAFDSYEIPCMGAVWEQYDSAAQDKFCGYVDSVHILNQELSYTTIRRMYAFQMGWI